MTTSTSSRLTRISRFLGALGALFAFLSPILALAQIRVWVPPVTTQQWHEGYTERVWVPPEMGTCNVPAVTHWETIPELWHWEDREVTTVVHHPESTMIVHHPEAPGVIHHPASTTIVHHEEAVGVVHIEEESHVVHHPAETRTIYVDGYYDTYWVDYYGTVCDVYCRWVYDYYSEGGWEECWEENCREEWIGGGWVDEWVEGYDYTETTEAWDETVIDVEEHDEYYTIPAWDEVVPIPAWDEDIIIPAWDQTVVVPAWDQTVTTIVQVKVVDRPASQVEIVDVPAHTVPCQITEGRFQDVHHPGWWETVPVAEGYWRTLQPNLAKKVVNGDWPTFDWNIAAAATLSVPVYSGDFNGDMVGWSISGLDEASPLTYTWKATMGSETVNGPSGQNMTEWKIATGSSAERLSWKPGDYVIRCDITRSNGQSAYVEYTQPVGWRTDRFLLIGQVKPISDFTMSPTQQAAFKADLIADMKNTGPLQFATWSSTISQQIDDLASVASLLQVISVWAGVNSLPPKRDASFPNMPYSARFYYVQEMLNANSDLFTLPTALNNVDKVNLVASLSYRMLSEYQVKYLVGADGKMIRSSVTSVGSPENPGGLAKLSLSGMTKLGLPSWGITILNLLGVPNNGSQLLIPVINNSHNGEEKIDRLGGRISLYTSGRVGYEASYVNYALFHRDVPYIYNEITFGLDIAGRDRNSSIPMSVNRVWNKSGLDGGSVHFNEIAIYRRRNGSEQYLLDRVFGIGGGANMLQFFIDSVPYGQFGVLFPGSTIPDPHQYEPLPQTPNTP